MTQHYDIELFSQRALLLGKQTAEDVPATLAAATHAFQIFDGKSSTETDSVERKVDRPFFAAPRKMITNRRRIIEGGIELVPPLTPGSQPAPCELMLEIGGMARSYVDAWVTRYNPISRDIECATAHWFHGKKFTEVTNARAAISGLTFKVGDFNKAMTKTQGSFTEVTDDDLPTGVDYSQFRDPVVVSAENSRMAVNGVRVNAKELSLDFGSDLKAKEFTDLRTHRIGDRVATYKARFVPATTDDLDVYELQRTNTIIPMSFLVIEDNGNTTMLTVRGQIEKIDESDEAGDFVYEISGNCHPTDDGGDEFLLLYSKPIALVDTMTDLGSVGSPYTEGPLGIKGAYVGPVTWSLASGAGPTGATLDPTTGLWTGNCTAAGTFTPTVRVTDAIGQTATLALSITISP
ncbi:MAG TPA: Ig domain-containing protein [Tahibacter sp.]|uniref:Ig domain-containing protein n=1 Tax=Tahibacter sp. TaxID=2056211 RepID=UPI002CC58EC2|nr:Ig domain-containing protein [Tahibacter sp.]HSX60897.1 Ig domain-containing protein [Tahibacter sp.]